MKNKPVLLNGIILIVLIPMFLVHTYSIYYEYLPTVIGAFEEYPKLHDYLNDTVYKVFYSMLIWPIILFSIILGCFISGWKTRS